MITYDQALARHLENVKTYAISKDDARTALTKEIEEHFNQGKTFPIEISVLVPAIAQEESRSVLGNVLREAEYYNFEIQNHCMMKDQCRVLISIHINEDDD